MALAAVYREKINAALNKVLLTTKPASSPEAFVITNLCILIWNQPVKGPVFRFNAEKREQLLWHDCDPEHEDAGSLLAAAGCFSYEWEKTRTLVYANFERLLMMPRWYKLIPSPSLWRSSEPNCGDSRHIKCRFDQVY